MATTGADDGVIDIGMRRDGSTIQFVIEDRARQVPLDRIKGRPLDDIRPGGLGIHLIREVMDGRRMVSPRRRRHAAGIDQEPERALDPRGGRR